MSARYTASGFADEAARMGHHLGVLKGLQDVLDLDTWPRYPADPMGQRNCDVIYRLGPHDGVAVMFCLRDHAPLGHVTEYVREHVTPEINRLLDDAMTWGEQVGTDLLTTAEPLTTPITAIPQTAAQMLERDVQQQASSLTGTFADLSVALTDWTGDSATNFRAYIEQKIQTATANQVILGNGIAATLAGVTVTLRSGRESLMSLAGAVRGAAQDQIALLEQREAAVDNGRAFLQLAQAATSVLSAIPVAPVAITASAVGAVLGLVESGIPPADQEEITLTEQDATALAARVREASATTVSRCDTHVQQIHDQRLTPLAQMVDDWQTLRLLAPPRPDIADGATSPAELGFGGA
ncbi:hypothetical protein ABFU82_21045 [Nocardioides sp. WV_118_6]